MSLIETSPSKAPAVARPARGWSVRWPRPHVVGAIFGRNFLGSLTNPAGYVFITLFVLVCSWFQFWQPAFFSRNIADLEPLNEWFPLILLFFVPAITMSIWAEERRQGTDELLLTLPARDVEVVLGKYLAATAIYAVSLLFLAIGHIAVLAYLGRPDPGVLAATYLGYLLAGSMLIAVGMVASALTGSVTVAFILGALFCSVPVFAGGFGPLGQLVAAIRRLPLVGRLFGAPGNPGGSGLGGVFEGLSVPSQLHDFGSGVVPLTGVFYFVALAGAMLYLNMVLIGRRHWAGGVRGGGRSLHALARTLAVVVALASVAVLIARWTPWRFDLTQERLHSLSPLTRQIVAAIPADRPVFIEAFVSRDVPRGFVEAKSNLLNTLREIAAIGGGRIRLNITETRRYSSEARDAERRYGILPRQVLSDRDDRQQLESIFLGVAFTSGPEQVVVPFVDPGLPIEYELARSLRVVSGGERKRIGILETDAQLLGQGGAGPMGPGQEWEVVRELRKQYVVTGVSPDLAIPTEEVQSISVMGEASGGTFTLAFGGATTGELPHEANAAAVEAALEALPAFEPGDVRVEGGPLPKEPLRVRFSGRLDGRNVALIEAHSRLSGPGKSRPTVRVGTTTEVIDTLIVPQAASLTARQIDNVADYVRRGGPVLVLVDPLPLVNPLLAPEEPRPPDRMSMMGQPSEPKGNPRMLLDLLGVEWPPSEIIWNPTNPHGQFEVERETLVLTRSTRETSFESADPVTRDLQEAVFIWSGHLRSREVPGDPRFVPLVRTNALGGKFTYGDLFALDRFGERTQKAPPYVPSGSSYVLAARVEGEAKAPARPVRAVVVADLDFLSNLFFRLRRQPIPGLEAIRFDNVTFVLNAIDVLAGDETFVTLRAKRPSFRTLDRLDQASRGFIARAQDEVRRAEDAALAELEAARKRLKEAVASIQDSKEYDERTKRSMVRYREQVENDRLAVQEAAIQDRKQRAIEDSRTAQEEQIATLQGGVRLAAVALPPLPALVLAIVVYASRSRRENRGANPARLA